MPLGSLAGNMTKLFFYLDTEYELFVADAKIARKRSRRRDVAHASQM